MPETVFALPVSVEQVAVVIKQMSPADQFHLLELVPNLARLLSPSTERTKAEARRSVATLREKVALTGALLAPDDPFLGHLTLRQYHALSEAEKTKLWDAWAGTDLLKMDEHEVQPDALSAR
jgi:hypothetical protein